jgi:hypothetical protein
MTTVDTCSFFRDWLLTDRKQPPPCQECASAISLLERAKSLEDHASAYKVEAERQLQVCRGKR